MSSITFSFYLLNESKREKWCLNCLNPRHVFIVSVQRYLFRGKQEVKFSTLVTGGWFLFYSFVPKISSTEPEGNKATFKH